MEKKKSTSNWLNFRRVNSKIKKKKIDYNFNACLLLYTPIPNLTHSFGVFICWNSDVAHRLLIFEIMPTSFLFLRLIKRHKMDSASLILKTARNRKEWDLMNTEGARVAVVYLYKIVVYPSYSSNSHSFPLISFNTFSNTIAYPSQHIII